tara:strand:- start:696 stop:1370 length:675 start_codon:yes stop_codon:yes gene_type:complete
MSFEELLQNAGLGGFSNLFGSGKDVASALGFSGDQVKNFAQFFQQFNKQDALSIAGQIAKNEATGTKNVLGGYSSNLGNLQQSLGEATSQIQGQAAKSGASFGATAKQMSETRKKSSESFQDLLRSRQMGLRQVEETRGREQAGLTSLFSNQIQSAYQRAREIYAGDPIMDNTPLIQPAGNVYRDQSNKINTNQLFMAGANPNAKRAGRDPISDQYYGEDYLYG